MAKVPENSSTGREKVYLQDLKKEENLKEAVTTFIVKEEADIIFKEENYENGIEIYLVFFGEVSLVFRHV